MKEPTREKRSRGYINKSSILNQLGNKIFIYISLPNNINYKMSIINSPYNKQNFGIKLYKQYRLNVCDFCMFVCKNGNVHG